MEAIRTEVRSYIVDNFLFGDPTGMNDMSSLLDAGIIDSTGILEMISFLETRFAVRVEDNEVLPENLDSIDNLVLFIGRKLGLPR